MPLSATRHPAYALAIADDHELLRKGLILILQAQGHTVVLEAESGTELLARLPLATTLPDLIIIDAHMPGLNGFDTVAAIRARWSGIKILALTMLANEQSRERMMACGANGYLSKDTPPDKLQEAIQSIMAHGAFGPANAGPGADEAPAKPVKLTSREREFLRLCCTDMTYRQMADYMELSPRSVERYSEVLYAKLGLQSRSGLVMYAVRTGLVNLE